MTMAPAEANLGAHSRETSEPAEKRAMSVPAGLKFSRAWTLRILSPKETSLPWLRREARATTSETGNSRSARMLSISWPTLPVAPTIATL